METVRKMERILVVDDNRQIAQFLVDELLPSLGYEASWVRDGKTALEYLANQPVSLMLLDIQLPDFSGLDVLRALAKEGIKIPTILVTAHGSEQIAVDAFRLGVQDYLTKPLDPESLNISITRALQTTRLAREKEILTNRLKGQITSLKVLSRVGKSVTSTLDLDEVLRRIVEAGVHLTRAEEGFLALVENQSQQLYLRAVKNIDQDKSKVIRLLVTDPIISFVLQSGKPYRSQSSSASQSLKVSTGFLVYSLLHVPLISKGKVIGVLSVDNQIKRREFTDSDEAILASLADFATVAIENASLYEKAQQEIQDRMRIEQALRESEKRYELAVLGANDGIWDWDLSTNTVYYSPRWKAMLGYSDEDIGTSPEEWFNRIHPSDKEKLRLDLAAHLNGASEHFENEYRILHKDGTFRWVLARGLAVKEPQGIVHRMAGSLTDITIRKSAEEKLMHDALHDALTGLPNRALLLDRINLAMERARRRENYAYAVLFLDLDRFKDVNDSLGHLMGDQLLQHTAALLSSGLRTTDTIARLGGDEFVILLDDTQNTQAAIRVANWIKEQLSRPIRLSDQDIFISASIGIVLSTTEYTNAEEILRDADIAMYYAKTQGKNRYAIFAPFMREQIMERLSLESELRLALAQGEIDVVYQPIISLQDGHLAGFEALARWNHAKRGQLLAKEFIPIAEECGLVQAIDTWVLEKACLQMQTWRREIPQAHNLTISVNLSGKHLAMKEMVGEIERILQQADLPPENLHIEFGERTIINQDRPFAYLVNRLRKLGIQVQIDDFGIGYSSLSQLSSFPIQALKIDQTFIKKMTTDENQLKIVQSIIDLTHRLGLGVIAEGIESNTQLDQLQQMDCDFGQGFLISKPLEAGEAKELLHQPYLLDPVRQIEETVV